MKPSDEITNYIIHSPQLPLSLAGLTFNTCLRLAHGAALETKTTTKSKAAHYYLEFIVECGYWAMLKENAFVIDVNDDPAAINEHLNSIESTILLKSVSFRNGCASLKYSNEISFIIVSMHHEADDTEWFASLNGRYIDSKEI